MTTAASVFANGGTIFLVFVVLFTLSVIYSLYTRRGSGINQRSYGKVYQGAPGAKVNLTRNVSWASGTPLPTMLTATSLLVWVGKNVTLPDTGR
jgi:hypothetical protein